MLTKDDIADIRNRDRTDTVVVEIMEDYDLSYTAVWRILTGRTYKHYDIVSTELGPQAVNKVSKLSESQIEEIKTTPRFWGSQTYFANKFGVSRRTVQRVLDTLASVQ